MKIEITTTEQALLHAKKILKYAIFQGNRSRNIRGLLGMDQYSIDHVQAFYEALEATKPKKSPRAKAKK